MKFENMEGVLRASIPRSDADRFILQYTGAEEQRDLLARLPQYCVVGGALMRGKRVIRKGYFLVHDASRCLRVCDKASFHTDYTLIPEPHVTILKDDPYHTVVSLRDSGYECAFSDATIAQDFANVANRFSYREAAIMVILLQHGLSFALEELELLDQET